jgi:hypothetical protein
VRASSQRSAQIRSPIGSRAWLGRRRYGLGIADRCWLRVEWAHRHRLCLVRNHRLRVLNLTTQSDGKMSFPPTTAQLELLAELEMARMPVAVIADRLGVDGATFKAWTARRDFEEPSLSRDYAQAPR